jgi:hypothetical protein
MVMRNPSLAARALAQLVDGWSIYSHGEHLSGHLSLAGFEVVNHGNFASVVNGLPNQVIKIFGLNDIGYQQLLHEFIHNKSDHYPAVYSFTTSGNYGIVEMEKLTHNTKTAVAISNYADRLKSGCSLKSHKWGITFKDAVLHLDMKSKEYNKTLKAVQLHWDGHEDNIMFRGTIPVLCDVFYGEKN